MSDSTSKNELIAFTTEIVSAYVSNNSVQINEISLVVDQVYKSLSGLRGDASVVVGDRPQPAVPIKRSITPDYLICLEDGKKLKMLKRHLKTAYNMTPEEYRERWGLPADYPMVAPNYAEKRSALAKDIGLGTRAR